MRTQLLFGVLGLALSGHICAAESGGGDDRGGHRFHVTAGVGAAMGQSPYPGDDAGIRFRPGLSIRWGPVVFRGRSLGVYIHRGDGWTVRTGISLAAGHTDRGESPRVSDMAALDRVVLARADVSHKADWGDLDFSFAADVAGKHSGYVAGLSYGYPFEIGPLRVKPKAGVEWQSAKINRYYYGVSAADVRPGRPLHEPGGAMNCELGVSVTYPIASRHALQFRAGIVFLSSEIADSPIVVRDRLAKVGVGYVYRFR